MSDNTFNADAAREWSIERIAKLDEGVTRLASIVDESAPDTAANLSAVYVAVKDIDEALEAVSKRLGEISRLLKHTLVPGAFEREGVTTITSANGYRVTISQVVRASMRDKEAGYEWLRGHGLGDVIVETVNASTLAAVARSLIEEGRELDDEIFNVAIVPNTSVTKTKK